MTVFTLLPMAQRGILAGVVFLSSVSLLALVLYGLLSRARAWLNAANTALFLALTGFTVYAMCAAAEPERYLLSMPWLWMPGIAVPMVLYGIVSIALIHDRRRDTLSPSSVKETLDNLDSGICFSDGNGRIILVNKTMAKLASILLGSYPQTQGELTAALARPDGKAEKLGDLYRFSDGKVWRFVSVTFEEGSLKGFVQTTAQDVTEVYNVNEKILAENEKLKEAIAETKALMVRLADRIREQETLALKIKVHNDIGSSLIALSQLLTAGEGENAERLLFDLQHAVWHFNTPDEPRKDTLDDVRRQAGTMGITLTVLGVIPTGTTVERIIVLAAKESVTNCYKHAGGDTVILRIAERNDQFMVTVTNNGESPKEEITEGGGLTSLRQTVEKAGGEMFVSAAPTFSLILNLPKEDKTK